MDDHSDHKLLNDNFPALLEALEILYIPGNQSGRIHFARQWPAVAAYLFDPALRAHDESGGLSREDRDTLESAAETRRLVLLETCQNLEARSVEKGVLQTQFVRGIGEEFGSDLARLLYSPRLMERLSPSAAAAAQAPQEAPKSVPPAPPPPNQPAPHDAVRAVPPTPPPVQAPPSSAPIRPRGPLKFSDLASFKDEEG